MKTTYLLIACSLLVGCATAHDPRLNGTWKSNREATMAEAYRLNPNLKEMTQDQQETYANIFGNLVITYSENTITTHFQGEQATSQYKLLEQGEDYAVCRDEDDDDFRITFDEDLKGCWLDCDYSFQERFDKLSTKPTPKYCEDDE